MFQKYCVVFQELFVVFADMGHRTGGNWAPVHNGSRESASQNATRSLVDLSWFLSPKPRRPVKI